MQTYRNIRRLNKIAVTLIRYGFGAVVTEMRVIPVLSSVERFFLTRRKGEGLLAAERLRLVLEELGPTFIKLGQIASTRADLLPPDWVDEFKKLQDAVPPFPFDDVKKTVEAALKSRLEHSFASFEERPVASASIAQVHFAVLRDGTKAAVKVKRPDIDRIIEADISVMRTFAGLLERYVPASRRYRPVEVVREFERVIKTEQDLTVEGANMARFLNLFKDNPDIQIPAVYWDYTAREVLTMERISGTPIDEVETLRSKGIDIKAVAVKGIEAFFRQVFDFGVFHGDLHPGNIFVRDDGVIIYLDFGIVGRLDRRSRKYLAEMLYHLVREDYHGMAAVHREMGLIGRDVSIEEFEDALREIAEPIYGRKLEEISISDLLMKLIQTARRFKMTLQPNLLLLQKSMVIIEGVGRQLYPDINMWEVAKPLIFRWMLNEKFSTEAFMKAGRDFAGNVAGSLANLPLNANSVLAKTLNDELRINFVHHRLDAVKEGLERAGAKIAAGLVVGSIVIAVSMSAVSEGNNGASFAGFPLIVWLVVTVAAITGIWLLRPSSKSSAGEDAD